MSSTLTSPSSPWTSGWAQKLLPLRRSPSVATIMTTASTDDNDKASMRSLTSSSNDSAVLLLDCDADTAADPQADLPIVFLDENALHHDPISLDSFSSSCPTPAPTPAPPTSSTPSSASSSSSSWRSFAHSAFSSARVRLGSVSSLASTTAAASNPSDSDSDTAQPPVETTSTPSSLASSLPPLPRDDSAPEYRLPWLGIGLPSASRRALRTTILALSQSRSTFTEPLNPDFDYTADTYSPLVSLLLAEDPNLASMRAKLVPRTLTDRDFWHNYLYRVSLAVTHAKLDAGVPGALLPLIKSCSGPLLVVTSPAVGSLVHRPRLHGVARSVSDPPVATTPDTRHAAALATPQDARGGGDGELLAGGGLVGLASLGPVDPMFVPLPEDDHEDDDASDGLSSPTVSSPTPSHTMVLHDVLPTLATNDPDLYSLLSSAVSSASPTTPTFPHADLWLDHDDDDDDDDQPWSLTDCGSATDTKPDEMDRMLEYDTDAFYVLLQDMALSAPPPVVHVPDMLPDSSTRRTRDCVRDEDGMTIISLE